MKLVSLTLENIKSYVWEKVDFYEGVNFISGINGAGKTTLIEAAGYALFDANPYSAQKQLIREGEKAGTITAVIEAKDERLYRIVRRLRLPAGGSWTVYDEETGLELNDLHGSQDVKAWLAENLGIVKGLDPTLLFEDVVGVSQGKFTVPFLARPAERKRNFDIILQLDSYRKAFEQTRGIESLFKDHIAQLEKQKEKMLGKVEDLPECKKELAEKEDLISRLKKEAETLNKELQACEQIIKEQEKQKEELEAGEKKKEALLLQSENVKELAARLEGDLREAAACRQIMEEAQESYQKYCLLLEKRKVLEAKRKERDDLTHKAQQAESRAAVLRAEIESEKAQRARQHEEWTAEQKEITAAGEKIKLEKEEVDRKLAQLEKDDAELERVKNRFDAGREIVDRLKQGMTVLGARIDQYRSLCQERKGLEVSLEEWERVEKSAAEIHGLKQEYEKLGQVLAQLRARQTALAENCAAARDGLCPFLEIPCRSVEGDLSDCFQREAERLLPAITELEQKEKELGTLLNQKRKDEEEYIALQYKKQQFARLEEQGKEAVKTATEEIRILLDSVNPEKIQLLQEQLESGAAMVGRWQRPEEYGQRPEEFLPWREECLRRQENYLAAWEQAAANNDLFSGENDLKTLTEKALALKEGAERFWSACASVINTVRQETVGNQKGLETRLNALREQYAKIAKNILAAAANNAIQAKEKQLQEEEKEISAYREKLAAYEKLDSHIEDNTKQADKLRPKYEQYLQNREGAAKEQSLLAEKERLAAETGRLEQETKAVEKKIRELKEKFLPDVLLKNKERREGFLAQKARQETEYTHAADEAERYRLLVREKEKAWREIAELEEMLDKEKRALELLRIVRSVLNKSGDKISHIYRQYIGREADLIYQQVAKENVNLTWGKDYEVIINDRKKDRQRERVFSQLSGGEKMTAALAVRLALLKHLSGLGVGFFDEPTANLDERRRGNLARLIPDVTREFRQVFVISHDDTFDAITDNVIMLQKDPDKGTKTVSFAGE